MIELSLDNLKKFDLNSSKGNQLKWERDGVWYKADYLGYEGLSEYIISQLFCKSSLMNEEYVVYDLEQIKYERAMFNGVSSRNFLPEGWQIVTLERLYKTRTGRSFLEDIWKIHGVDERLGFLVEQVVHLTGLDDFGIYISKMLTIDAFFLNEDRHMHNIAVLTNGSDGFDYCPFFDHGAGLLSDTSITYLMGENVYDLMKDVRSKTISPDFDEALDAAEKKYGDAIKFNFTKGDVTKLLKKAQSYPDEVKRRVETIIYNQMNKYGYLFKD